MRDYPDYHGKNGLCRLDPKVICQMDALCRDCKLAATNPRLKFHPKTRKCTLVMTTTAVLLSITLSPAYAISGVGDIVYDPLNYNQNLISAVQAVQEVTNQYTQIQNQFTQIEYALRNLSLDATSISDLKKAWNNLLNLSNYITVLVSDYSQAQAAWDRVYPQYSTYAGMSASDYADIVEAGWSNANQALLGSQTMNAIATENGTLTKSTVDKLIASSDSAEGALVAAQLGNKLAATQSAQLQTLTEVVAKGADAQTSFYAYQMSYKAVEEQEKSSFRNLTIPNTTTSKVGQDIPE